MGKDGFEKSGGIEKSASNDNSKPNVEKVIAEMKEFARLNGVDPFTTEEETMIREELAKPDAEIVREVAETEGDPEVVAQRTRQRLMASLSDFRAKDKQSLRAKVIKGDKD